MPSRYLKELWDILTTVLKWPLLITVFSVNAFLIIPFMVMSMTKYGVLGFFFLLLAESPMLFLAAKEAWRQWTLQPATDRWETSPEKWNEAVDDFVKMVDDDKE